MHLSRVWFGSCCLVVVLACGPREPGPHENERGQVFYWRVIDSEVSFGEECTDNESFRDGIEPPQFEANSFIIYELSDDGSEAVTLSCTTTDAESCTESSTGIVFRVDEHELIYDPEPRVQDVANNACDLEGDELWTLLDQGETLELAMEIAFARAGDPSVCDASEASIAAQSPNGKGLDGCVITLGVSTEFYDTGRR